MSDSFEKESLEHLTSLEQLDRTLVVVGIRAWLLLLFFAALIVAIVSWALLGTLPITVAGKCLVFDPYNLYELRNPPAGIVKEIHYFGGQKIKQGEAIVTYENPDSEIIAPMNGEVLWIDLSLGRPADPTQIAVAFQGEGPVSDLRIIGFLPLFSGQKVRVGMEALAALGNANPEQYGMIRARVKEIFPFPVGTSEHYMQKIPSKELLDYLTDNGSMPTLLVIAEPIINLKNPSKLEWTSNEGPPYMIFPGSVGKIEIHLENVTPISYVIPKKE